ncbi:unnamed protein product [Periconia digitata]|uniref:Uncharacterized protein n=1 Tax=Periconia digitata TaxID=1303443 RepID=A0A9W4U8M7_9PLEO|nr:unnamed protein product [Periconia digitata]
MAKNPLKRTIESSNVEDLMVADHVPPYDLSNRDIPPLPFFSEGAVDAAKTGKCLVELLRKNIRNHPYKGKEVDHMISWLDQYKTPKYRQRNLYLALVGRSGAGKSSLLNALLGHDIAEHNAEGGSVTYVIQEFHYLSRPTSQPFEAHIEFHPFEEWKGILTRHFNSYMEYRELEARRKPSFIQDSLDDEDEDSDEEVGAGVDDDKLTEARARATATMTVLHALFPERFPSPDTARLFLEEAAAETNRDKSEKLAMLLHDLEKIYDSVGLNQDDTVVYAESQAEDLKALVKPFITEDDHPAFIPATNIKCSLWAMVKRVRYKLRSHVLKTGCVLVDTPGDTDTNLFRVDETARYIQSADKIILVDDFSRIYTEDGNFRRLQLVDSRKGPGHVIVVGTNSDKADNKGDKLPYTPGENDELKEIWKQISEMRQAIKVREREQNEAELQSDYESARNIKADVALKKKLEACLSRRANSIIWTARHRRVSAMFHTQYRNRTGYEKVLPFFLVSSSEWNKKHLLGYQVKKAPRLSREATGVPGLIDYLLGLPTEAKFASLCHWITDVLPFVLDRIESLPAISHLEQKEIALEYCEITRKNMCSQIEDRFQNLEEKALNSIVEQLGKHGPTAIEAARKVCKEKEKNLRASSHLAVLKRNGKHKTPKISQQDWNDSFLESVRNGVRPTFINAAGRVDAKVKQVNKDFRSSMDELVEKFRSDPSSGRAVGFSTSLDAFGKSRIAFLRHEVELTRGCLIDDIRDVQSKATESVDNSYFAEIMVPIYKTVINEPVRLGKPKGKSQHKIRCETLESKVCMRTGGPFSKLTRKVESELRQTAWKYRDELAEKVGQQFQQIEDDIRLAMEDNDDDGVFDQEREKFFKKLVGDVHEARKLLEDADKKLQTAKNH